MSSACAQAVVAAQAVQGQVALLSGLGAEVAGSASTLGRPLGRTRIAMSARAGYAQVRLPNAASTSFPAPEASFLVPTVHAGVAIGVFDGFFLKPTLGGFLSLDLLGGVSTVLLPADRGFEDRVAAWTYGVRVGLLRETFTAPGVTVSVTRRAIGEVILGSTPQADGYQVVLEPSVTSVRATVGKDLFAVGVLAGIGWDDLGGSAAVAVRDGSASQDAFGEGRALVFGGASMNFLILQVSAEGGWAQGLGSVAGYNGSFDPAAGTYFGSVAFRLTI